MRKVAAAVSRDDNACLADVFKTVMQRDGRGGVWRWFFTHLARASRGFLSCRGALSTLVQDWYRLCLPKIGVGVCYTLLPNKDTDEDKNI